MIIFLIIVYTSLNVLMIINLIHLPLGKMAATSETIFSDAFVWIKSCVFRLKFRRMFVPKGPIDNKWALVQAMAWRRTGDKPVPEPMLTQFNGAYMRD